MNQQIHVDNFTLFLGFFVFLFFFTGNITDNEVIFSYSEQFYSNNITIIFNLSHQNPLISFTINISVVQRLSAIVLEGLHRSIALALLYNTDYNISVVASFCGHIIATNSFKLFYGMYMNKNCFSSSVKFLIM